VWFSYEKGGVAHAVTGAKENNPRAIGYTKKEREKGKEPE